jgi:hypothetical protein
MHLRIAGQDPDCPTRLVEALYVAGEEPKGRSGVGLLVCLF